MKWFGEPWPSDWEVNGRAPVCENDSEHVPTPLGAYCLYCDKGIGRGDQGVLIPFIGGPDYEGPEAHYVHIKCLMRNVLGPGADNIIV